MLPDWAQEVRYAIRALLRQPAFTAVAAITLALGVGAGTLIYTVVDAALMHSLPYADADRLTHLWETTPRQEFGQREASYPDFLDWSQSDAFEGMAGYSRGNMVLKTRGLAENLPVARVTADFFPVLGVEPALGRSYRREEGEPGAEPVVILSGGLHARLFGGDPGILGKTLLLNDREHTVIGILPPEFQFAPVGAAELWVPLGPSPEARERRYMHWVKVIGRLKSDVTIEGAHASMGLIARRIAEEYPESHAGTGIRIVPLRDQILGSVRPALLVLLAAVVVVMLLTCANVAGLVLVRSAARQQELAARIALGARPARLFLQQLTESVILGLVGGAGGFWLAWWGVAALQAAMPALLVNSMPYLRNPIPDWRVLGFSLALALLSGLVFGMAPAFLVSRSSPRDLLQQGSRIVTGSLRQRLRRGLVIVEIALALMLAISAGLLSRSLYRLLEVDPGFNPRNLLTLGISLPGGSYADPQGMVSVYRELLSRLEGLPGIRGAGMVSKLPLAGGNTTVFDVEGMPPQLPGQEVEANIRQVSEGYFRVMGIPLLRGRVFEARDELQAPAVALVNRTLADRMFRGRDPLGQRLTFVWDNRQFQIVGIVGDEKLNGLDVEARAAIYTPLSQNPGRDTNLVLRTAGAPGAMASAVRQACLAVEPEAALYGILTMEQVIRGLPAAFVRGYPAIVVGIFAALALLLSIVGVYGIVAYAVGQRTREIGIRMAIGAEPGSILSLFMKEGMVLICGGVVLGLLGALASTRWLASLLFAVPARDMVTFIGVSLLLSVLVLLAIYIPARRATRVDPVTALRRD